MLSLQNTQGKDFPNTRAPLKRCMTNYEWTTEVAHR